MNSKPCILLRNGICEHKVLGPLIVDQFDCDACISFDGKESEQLTQIAAYRATVQSQGKHESPRACVHLGNKLSVSPCCGQMYKCNLHKGKKCVAVGFALPPFLSCQMCPDNEQTHKTVVDRNRFAGRCVAVTSLSPNPARAERQSFCLRSWRDIGLQILAVNTADEHAGFADEIREHITPVVSDDLSIGGRRQTQRINALLKAGAATGHAFMLINADVEIYGDHTIIEKAIASPTDLTIGIRHNYDPGEERITARKECSGLDVFVMTPKMAATVPDLPFSIGMPVWDYWIPHHFAQLGCDFRWIDDRLFYHETHDLQWSREDWTRGGKWLSDYYGLSPDAAEKIRVEQWRSGDDTQAVGMKA